MKAYYDTMTEEDFTYHLSLALSDLSANELYHAVPDIASAVREHYNNEVRDSWAKDDPRAAYFPVGTRVALLNPTHEDDEGVWVIDKHVDGDCLTVRLRIHPGGYRFMTCLIEDLDQINEE